MQDELSLFDPANVGPDEGAWPVSAVTSRARQMIETGFRLLWVKGEVANFKSYRSGHWYFSLRDATSQIRCVMWRDDTRGLDAPEDGVQVFVEARPTVWEERGEFRLTARRMIATQAGGLWELQLQRARAALERDGLLDPAKKRPLPAYPDRIAVVTSPDGAALKDIVSVLNRRWPAVALVVVPTVVQGDLAEKQLCQALERVNRLKDVDVVIVGRGGGSREDLWAFNSEKVARAVAALRVPVISAVGHETDVSLTDLVADHRAPTPSAAAESAVPSRGNALDTLDAMSRSLANSLIGRIRFGNERLARTADRLQNAVESHAQRGHVRLEQAAGRLDALSPLKVLKRGFGLPRSKEGKVLRSVSDFHAGAPFLLTVTDGEVRAQVEEGP